MTKRITANKAGMIYSTQYAKNVFEQKEADKMKEVIKLVKILQARGHKITTAAPIAKRAYRMGIRA